MDAPPVASREEAQGILEFFLEQEKKLRNRWRIARKSDGRLIGTCGFHHWERHYFRAEIGYDLAPDCWGQGIVTEVLRAAMNNGLDRMGLNRIDVIVYVDNPAWKSCWKSWVSNRKGSFAIIPAWTEGLTIIFFKGCFAGTGKVEWLNL